MGQEAIASRLGIELETYRHVDEPWLERMGLIERTERGRVATRLAQLWYGPGRKPLPTSGGSPILPFRLRGA